MQGYEKSNVTRAGQRVTDVSQLAVSAMDMGSGMAGTTYTAVSNTLVLERTVVLFPSRHYPSSHSH